jgi:hypothetical protein
MIDAVDRQVAAASAHSTAGGLCAASRKKAEK